jgi:type IX secretion system PorP/SprF family membrane protein
MKAIVIVFCLLACSLSGQDPALLNTNQNLIALNPSYAGSNGLLRNQFSYRNVWPEFRGGHTLMLNSADVFLKGINGGVAASAQFEQQSSGLYTSWTSNLAYAQHFTLCEGAMKVVPSVQLGYFVKQLDVNSITFGQGLVTQWSPSNGAVARKQNVTLSSGFLMQCDRGLSAGAYFFQINQPDEGLLGESPLPLRSVQHISYSFKMGERNLMQVLTRFSQQSSHRFAQIAVNTVLCNHVIAGLSYLSGDNLQITGGLRAHYFNLVLGYDITTSRLAGNSAGSWEFSLSFNLRDKEHRRALMPFEKM